MRTTYAKEKEQKNGKNSGLIQSKSRARYEGNLMPSTLIQLVGSHLLHCSLHEIEDGSYSQCRYFIA